jgi:hypothetical protein
MANGFHILKYSRPDSKQPFFCMMSKGEDPKRKKEKEKRRKREKKKREKKRRFESLYFSCDFRETKKQ